MKTYAFLQKYSYINKYTNKSPTILNAANPIVGLDMGIPLNMIQDIFTNIHYGYDITTFKSIVLQFLIGYYTYGKDRYKDALEYNENKFDTPKMILFEFLIKYKDFYKLSYDTTLLIIMYMLIFDESMFYNIPFIFLLYSSEYYKDIKKIGPFIKPLYISIMWTLAVVALPCVLKDHNYNILAYPLDYLPCALTMFSSSTILDIRDIEEDKFNNVKTIPVVYGFEYAQILTLSLLALSSLIFGINDNYLESPIKNSIFEFINVWLSYYVYKQGINLRVVI
tara:strand:- start:377 stop:1216 length:840 start_codon:yes stop_codon:yes gene_type:complete